MKEEIIDSIVEYIKKMNIDESDSISSIAKKIYSKDFTSDELFDINKTVIDKCEDLGIILDYSNYKDQIVGLPFNLPFVKKSNVNYYKKNETDIIWWISNPNQKGLHQFSFDKVRIYNLFKDYPYNLTKEEIEIFDKENPYWADFFKDGRQSDTDSESKKIQDDLNYERRQVEELLKNNETKVNNRMIELEKIKDLYFVNDSEFFDEISQYLIETFDYDILSNTFNDNCIRFELYDSQINKKLFFAINKNLFIINAGYKHTLKLRGNSSEERITSLINEVKRITATWNPITREKNNIYWGLTIINNNKCSLYVGMSKSIDNWNKFISIINEQIKELMNNTITEIIL